ncbi:MAG: trypsin-like peptidase domain-containing protein, partial [Candidatus Nealsonbacteria bacterium]|nr:trypsin-like peptidase domain-containing protein [Candidatus Nealsonbacteria bacterium]
MQQYQQIDPFFGPFQFEVPQQRQNGTQKQEVGGGTGFIVTSDGIILTNKHVVSDDTAEYMVYTNTGKKYPAKVLALDPVQDLAVIKIEPEGGTAFPTVKLG